MCGSGTARDTVSPEALAVTELRGLHIMAQLALDCTMSGRGAFCQLFGIKRQAVYEMPYLCCR
eukprot:3784289-Amphidinium_carterae.1